MSATYESEELLNQYLLFHFGTSEEQFPYSFGAREGLHFPQRCAELALAAHGTRPLATALDLGCAVGGSAFALSAKAESTLGIDFSARFIDAAKQLKRTGFAHCRVREEGDRFSETIVRLPAESKPDTVTFREGDAMNLDASLQSFDLVLACNLICRLPDPAVFLARLPDLVVRNGTLLVTTPLTWLEEFTPHSAWLSTPAQSGLESLRAALGSAFRLEKREDLPFLIREHQRKYQFSVAECTIWRRI